MVRFFIGSDGVAREVSVVAGVEGLDQAAVAAVRRVGRFPGGTGWVRVPIEFRL